MNVKSFGLDTSIVIRLLMSEPENQAAAAKAFLETCWLEGTCVLVNDMVVMETYHALIYHYKVPKKEAISTLLDFLLSPMITAKGHALEVLRDYRGTGAGLVDRLIRMDLLENVNEIVTFDEDFSRLKNVRKLDCSIE